MIALHSPKSRAHTYRHKNLLDANKYITKSGSEISPEKVGLCFRKTGFVIPSSENDHESVEQQEENEEQSQIN